MIKLTRSKLFSNLLKSSKRNFCESSKNKSENPQDEEEIWDDEDEEMDEEEGPSYKKRILKWLFFTSTTSLLIINGKYVLDTGSDPILGSLKPFYIKPFYKSSSYIIEKSQEGYDYLRYPPMKKFLPDEPPINKQMLRKTLVLNFEGTLYSKDFKAGEGLVLHLRPGFRKFIKDMTPKYEIVIYTKEDTNFINEVVQTIDPFQTYLHWYFGNEFLSTYSNGLYKDLKFLNRGMDRVVVVDFDKDIYLNNKNNVIFLEKYDGEKIDDSLKDLSLFLNHLSDVKVRDVRTEIKKYGGFKAVGNYKDNLQSKFDKMKKKRSYFAKNIVTV